MKSVLASLKPYYYYLIGEGIKKIEVRKDMPKARDWNKEVLFYMSKDVKSFAKIPKEFQGKYRKHFGKVGLKFICDKVEKFIVGGLLSDDIEKLACLSYTGMINYYCARAKFESDGTLLCNTEINRAPQSWCYVEELKEKQK